MARLTPNEILKLSEPVEQVYSNIVDALLINMGKHFNSGHTLSTEQWEIRKLAELGQLNKESVEIIASLTGQNKELITAALENAVYMATKDIEPELKKAVQKGAIQNAAADNVIASQSIVQALNAYEQQAMDKLNLVNTTMLESTLAQYRKVITNTVNIERQMKAAQEVLNIATGKVITGTESRQQALRQALSQIHKEGITGFSTRIKGFDMEEAVLSGVESRTSSPVRILRGDSLQSVTLHGLYPCGEGAGYAGGITSAAVDGLKIAEQIATN